MSDLSNLTGIPTGKKTRRRRKAGSGPSTHHANLGRALASDDHDTARKHAFHLIRSLRPATVKEAITEGEPAMTEVAEVTALEPEKPKTPNVSRLVAALRAKKGI